MRPRRRDGIGLALAVAGWVVALVLVAAAGEAVVVQRAAPPVTQPTGTAPGATAASPVGSIPGANPSRPTGGSRVPAGSPGAADGAPVSPPPTTEPGFDFGTSDPLPPAPPAAGLLPVLPVIELPPLPDELRALVAVTSPTARQACSLVGTVVVLSALVKGDLETAGIPVSEALTYLGPVFQVCELFPADEPSICAVDTALNDSLIPEDLRLLVGVPTLGALALDQAAAIETALGSVTGTTFPGALSDLLISSLGCELR